MDLTPKTPIDPDIADLIWEEQNRVPSSATVTTEGLTVLDARGGELRWESDRFHREDPQTMKLDQMAEQYLKHMEADNE